MTRFRVTHRFHAVSVVDAGHVLDLITFWGPDARLSGTPGHWIVRKGRRKLAEIDVMPASSETFQP